MFIIVFNIQICRMLRSYIKDLNILALLKEPENNLFLSIPVMVPLFFLTYALRVKLSFIIINSLTVFILKGKDNDED